MGRNFQLASAAKRVPRLRFGLVTTGQTRRGFSLLEVIVAMILLGAVLAVVVPFAKRANERQRATEGRRAALLEVSNALERITADPATGPAAGEEKEVPLPEAVARRFDEPRLVVRGTAL